jgi:predicted transcriptional regulator
MPLPNAPDDAQVLIDDGQWHTLHLDARAIRQRWPEVTVAMRFAFEGQWQTARNEVKEGHEFWIGEVTIGPEQE